MYGICCRWDLLIVVCVAYNCLVLPPRIAFADGDIGALFLVDLILDFIFMFDVFMNLETGRLPTQRFLP